MDRAFLATFVDLLAVTLQVLILLRVLLSWFRPRPTGPGRYLIEVTDPILLPFQKLLPPMAGLDFSPIVALITIQILQSILHSTLTGG